MPKLKKFCSYGELVSKILIAEKTTSLVTITLANHLVMRVMGKDRNKYWYYRNPKTKRMEKIGTYPEMTLALANEQIKKMTKLQAESEAFLNEDKNLFDDLAQEYLNYKKDTKNWKYQKTLINTNLKPFFGLTPDAITNKLIKKTLLSQNLSPNKLHRCLNIIIAIMNLAVENELIPYNHAAVLRNSIAFPKIQQTAGRKYLPIDETRSIWETISQKASKIWQQYFLLQCLLCIRPGECLKIRFEYCDFDKQIITIPGELMKVQKPEPFRIPINEKITCLIKNIRQTLIERGDLNPEFLFESTHSHFYSKKPYRITNVSNVIKKKCGLENIQAHGFRKTARTFFAKKGVSYEVAAKMLDHSVRTGADSLYQKSDLLELRAKVMNLWTLEVEKNLPESMKVYLK